MDQRLPRRKPKGKGKLAARIPKLPTWDNQDWDYIVLFVRRRLDEQLLALYADAELHKDWTLVAHPKPGVVESLTAEVARFTRQIKALELLYRIKHKEIPDYDAYKASWQAKS